MIRKITLFLAATLITLITSAQVVTLDPFFASQTNTVTVTFDATLGNGALTGVNQVYAHTGVITNLSTGPTDWRHVVGNWGTADPVVQMTNIGNNKHTITYNINTFYNVPGGETVERLAFVFRNADGSLVGRNDDQSDIFVDLFTGDFASVLTLPAAQPYITTTLADTFEIKGVSSDSATLSLFHDGNLLTSATNATEVTYDLDVSNYGYGKYWITMEADDGDTIIVDSLYYIAQPSPNIGLSPSGTLDGINYMSSTDIRLQLHAPQKDFVYVIGDFNNWELDPAYYMTKTPDGARWWLDITGLTPGQEYRFQYLVDDEAIRIADIYADKILDPWNDQWIDATTYPNLIGYPEGKTNQPVSILQTNQTPYPWDPSINYTRPAKEDLVVYELLIRDFVETHDYATLIDSLAYFEKLGINAIQLMPVNEFEGNESWGYNPSFYFAPDKYYGPKDKMKEFVEECHRRGIAVIMDIALNHSFGQNPQVRLYFDPSAGSFGQPTPASPWFHETARHDFNVGYDYDHESAHTRVFMKRVLEYWVNEYQIDGYRLDLSKGFTNVLSIGNIGLWNSYDASRVAILNDYGNHVWNIDPDVYMILEHFADNSEETDLSNHGFMLWGNINHEYNEATMGYPSDLTWGSYQARNWNDPHLISFMESHDEERLMYKNQEFGNSNGSYDITDLSTGLARVELASAFFYTIPGPKMLWQFGEQGYDYSINYCENGTIDPGCRTGNKPIRWDYLQQADRERLFKVTSALIKLKTSQDAFRTTTFDLSLNGFLKRINLDHSSMNVTVIGNFNVSPGDIDPNFQHTGTWYEYFTGDSIEVTGTNDLISLVAGEYRLYTDVKLDQPDLSTDIETFEGEGLHQLNVYPNPFSDQLTLEVELETNDKVQLQIFDPMGKVVANIRDQEMTSGLHRISWDGRGLNGQSLSNGLYFYQIRTSQGTTSGPVVLNR